MVTKHNCDKCGKDIGIQEDDFNDMILEEISLSSLKEGIGINKPELCKECLKGYKKIIVETNKRIADYIKD